MQVNQGENGDYKKSYAEDSLPVPQQTSDKTEWGGRDMGELSAENQNR